jgi:hypothetical protein
MLYCLVPESADYGPSTTGGVLTTESPVGSKDHESGMLQVPRLGGLVTGHDPSVTTEPKPPWGFSGLRIPVPDGA